MERGMAMLINPYEDEQPIFSSDWRNLAIAKTVVGRFGVPCTARGITESGMFVVCIMHHAVDARRDAIGSSARSG